MGSATDVAAVALVIIALTQVALTVGLLVAIRRVLAELRPLSTRLQDSLARLEAVLQRVDGLADQASQGVAQARHLAAQAATLTGVVRIAAESLIGGALLRRLLGGGPRGGTDGGVANAWSAARAGMDLAAAVWRALAARRARRVAVGEPAAPAGERDRVDSAAAGRPASVASAASTRIRGTGAGHGPGRHGASTARHQPAAPAPVGSGDGALAPKRRRPQGRAALAARSGSAGPPDSAGPPLGGAPGATA